VGKVRDRVIPHALKDPGTDAIAYRVVAKIGDKIGRGRR
jgi:hypothetical protein